NFQPLTVLKRKKWMLVNCYIRKAFIQNERNKVKQRLQNSPPAKQCGTRVIKPTTSYTDYSNNNFKHGTKSDKILTSDSLIIETQT
ncbi:28368_t:CDS:1, partial [Racocetra persica]